MTADIVYVDDEPGMLQAAARAGRSEGRFLVFAPENSDDDEIIAAERNLWILDFFNEPLDPQQGARDQAGSNGMTLFQKLRYLAGDYRPPTVLVSNALEAAIGTDVDMARRHLLADELGVEWIAPKTDRDGASTLPELLAIADAVKTVRAEWTALRDVDAPSFTAEFAHRILALPRNSDWLRLASRDVAAWRPPSLSDGHVDHRPAAVRGEILAKPDLAAARSVIGWLIRQVLFYPSFVVSRRHVAVRLGITVACLDAAMAANTSLRRKLARMRYKGALAELVDGRWWSAGIDGLAWTLPRGRDERSAALSALLAPVVLEELGFIDPVVVSDADLTETDEVAPAAECVRATDEHFPANAPPAWVKVDEARQDRALARRVRAEDQERLEAAA